MSKFEVPVVEYTLENHPNADTLSIAHIKGWQCVVKTSDFESEFVKLGVYVPLDTIAEPDHPLLGFLEGKKVKTIKLRKVLSQGVLLPFSAVSRHLGYEPRLGDDLAEALKLKKYEAPLKTCALIKGSSQNLFLPRPDWFHEFTDIENWKNYPFVIKDDEPVIITEKIHGTNAVFGLSNTNEFFVGSHHKVLRLEPYVSNNTKIRWSKRNILRKLIDSVLRRKPELTVPPENVWTNVANRLDMKNVLLSLKQWFVGCETIVLYGEIIGQGIQDLTYGLSGVDLYVFGIKVDGQYIDPRIVQRSVENAGLKFVPVLYEGLFNQDCLKLADGKTTLNAEHVREGIVIEALVNRIHPMLGRVILKRVSDDYLMRKNGTDN